MEKQMVMAVFGLMCAAQYAAVSQVNEEGMFPFVPHEAGDTGNCRK